MRGMTSDALSPMPDTPLGTLTPEAFMRRHWHKKPAVIRAAWPGAAALINQATLFKLAAQDDVESRLVQRRDEGWRLRHGPFTRRQLPALAQPGWTLLVQGVDLHHPPAHAWLNRFRFIPAARLDDVMVSWASEGGGVGPHLDAYDVFLLQVQGNRRWRIGRLRRAADAALVPGLPLKILARFEPEQEVDLHTGDMLYLPPRWAHDGAALGGACITASVGFRSPSRTELAREVLLRMTDALSDDAMAGAKEADRRYRDPDQPATLHSGRIPAALQDFAMHAVIDALNDRRSLSCALGEVLSEPKPGVWFDGGEALAGRGAVLDCRTRMVYDDETAYINGEAYRMTGRDAHAMRRLADRRALTAHELAQLSEDARAEVEQWALAGWLRPA